MQVLSLTKVQTREALEAAATGASDLEFIWVPGAGELLHRLAELPANSLVVLERDVEAQLPQCIRRIRGQFPQASVVLLCPNTARSANRLSAPGTAS